VRTQRLLRLWPLLSDDLHRMALYEALGWPRPKDSDEEKALGRRLTEFLWRGTDPGVDWE